MDIQLTGMFEQLGGESCAPGETSAEKETRLTAFQFSGRVSLLSCPASIGPCPTYTTPRIKHCQLSRPGISIPFCRACTDPLVTTDYTIMN